MIHPMLNIAIRAARKAGNVIIKSYENPASINVENKGENDFSTSANTAAEALIIEVIRKSYKDHTIISEEAGLIKGLDNDVQWIIDPIDGTTNFIKGIPHCSVAIAVRIKGKTEVAVVYNPMANELFTATRGQGAQLNGYRIRTGNPKGLENSILAVAYPYKDKAYGECYLAIMQKLLTKSADFRRTGSPALDFAYIASGRIDGFFEIGLKPWDIAAGELILREAGGIITDFVGGNNYMVSGNVVAGSPKIVKEFISLTQNEWPDRLKN